MSEHFIDYEILIARYLDSEITPNEKEQLLLWVDTSEKNKEHFVQTAKVWEQSIIDLQDRVEAQQRFDAIFTHIKRTKKRTLFRRAFSAAAAVVLLFFGWQLFQPNFLFGEKMLTAISGNTKKEVILPDSSTVWLNAGSKLKYPAKFRNERDVHLTGEAYFSVRKDEKRIFSVHTDNMHIEVFGTTFLVTDRKGAQFTETVLESGKINLTIGASGEKIALKPNQKIIYDKNAQSSSLHVVKASDYTAWRQKSIVFENAPLSDVFVQLEKWYNLEIDCNNNDLLNTPVSFTIDEEPVEDIMSILEQITSLTWKKIDNRITIH